MSAGQGAVAAAAAAPGRMLAGGCSAAGRGALMRRRWSRGARRRRGRRRLLLLLLRLSMRLLGGRRWSCTRRSSGLLHYIFCTVVIRTQINAVADIRQSRAAPPAHPSGVVYLACTLRGCTGCFSRSFGCACGGLFGRRRVLLRPLDVDADLLVGCGGIHLVSRSSCVTRTIQKIQRQNQRDLAAGRRIPNDNDTSEDGCSSQTSQAVSQPISQAQLNWMDGQECAATGQVRSAQGQIRE